MFYIQMIFKWFYGTNEEQLTKISYLYLNLIQKGKQTCLKAVNSCFIYSKNYVFRTGFFISYS